MTPSPFAGMHECGSCRRQHGAAYETWCSAERRRLHPSNFERWTEAEHAGKRLLLTWAQQQNVWAHMDAGEAWASGEMTRGQYEYLVTGMEPLPRVPDLLVAWAGQRARARIHRFAPQPADEERAIERAMGLVVRITPDQMADEEESVTGQPVSAERRREIADMLEGLYRDDRDYSGSTAA